MVSADAPKFIKAVPGEIEEHGLAAAVVLAHIRYRCESDSPGHGLVEIDGARWWPVSHRTLGGEIGLSADAVRRALQKLGDVVVSANNRDRPEDQTRAYRPADDSDSVSSQNAESPRSEQPECDIAEDRGDFAEVPRRNRGGTAAISPTALPIETTETFKTEDTPDPQSDEPSATRTLARVTGSEIARAKFSATPVTDNSAFAKRIAHAYSDSLPVPIEAGVLTKIGVEADKCLRSGIPPDAIAAGIREWASSDSWSPTQIPTFVTKAAHRVAKTATGIGKPTENALGYQAAGEALIARLESA